MSGVGRRAGSLDHFEPRGLTVHGDDIVGGWI